MKIHRGLAAALAVFILAAAAALAQGQAIALTARDEALAAEVNGIGIQITLAEGDLLRITATAREAEPKPLPAAMRVSVPRKTAVPAQSGGGYALGPYTLRPDGSTLLVSLRGQPRFRIGFERAGKTGVRTPIALAAGAALYGMGECVKSLALGESYLTLYNKPAFGDQTYLYVPYFFGSAGDAFLFEAAGKDAFAFKNGREATAVGLSGRVDVLYWQEADPAAVTARLYAITGAQTLLPRWAYGFIQSKYGYRNEAELRTIVNGFSQFRLPLSAVVLDLYWFSRMGDLDWNREAFPDPAGLDTWLESKGVKLLTISEPFFTLDSKLYDRFSKAGLFAMKSDGSAAVWNDWWTFGGTGGSILNPVAAGVERILGDRYVELAKTGVDGFWTDLGEPENVPASALFGQWNEAEFHQAYNKEWSRLVHDALAGAFPGKRPFILSRSGYLGSTGYGVSIWSGDAPANWDGLKAQTPLGLQAGLSGFPYWGSDAGGFTTPGGELVPPDPERFYRWLQFAAFTPVFRAHGMGPREPWIYGQEWFMRNATMIAARASMLPYVYSTAYQVWANGLPMMRPLFFMDPADPRLAAEDSSFLFGDWLLVAPITKPLSAEKTKKIYLPKGAWYNVVTMTRDEGGREIELPLTMDTLPVFAREGAILPMDLNGRECYLLLPGTGPSRFVAFSDDGTSEAYLAGAGEKLLIGLDAKGFTVSGAAKKKDVVIVVPKAHVKLKALAGSQIDESDLYSIVNVTVDKGENRFEF